MSGVGFLSPWFDSGAGGEAWCPEDYRSDAARRAYRASGRVALLRRLLGSLGRPRRDSKSDGGGRPLSLTYRGKLMPLADIVGIRCADGSLKKGFPPPKAFGIEAWTACYSRDLGAQPGLRVFHIGGECYVDDDPRMILKLQVLEARGVNYVEVEPGEVPEAEPGACPAQAGGDAAAKTCEGLRMQLAGRC